MNVIHSFHSLVGLFELAFQMAHQRLTFTTIMLHAEPKIMIHSGSFRFFGRSYFASIDPNALLIKNVYCLTLMVPFIIPG
jgi:hypothetical protein